MKKSKNFLKIFLKKEKVENLLISYGENVKKKTINFIKRNFKKGNWFSWF